MDPIGSVWSVRNGRWRLKFLKITSFDGTVLRADVNLPKAKGSEKFPAPGPSLCLLCFKICKLLRLVQRFGDQSQGVWDLMDTHGMSNKPHGKMVWYSLPTWTNYSYKWWDSLKTTFGRVLIIPDWNALTSLFFSPNLRYLLVGYPWTHGVSNNFKILPAGEMIQFETYVFSKALIHAFWWFQWSNPFRSIFPNPSQVVAHSW